MTPPEVPPIRQSDSQGAPAEAAPPPTADAAIPIYFIMTNANQSPNDHTHSMVLGSPPCVVMADGQNHPEFTCLVMVEGELKSVNFTMDVATDTAEAVA